MTDPSPSPRGDLRETLSLIHSAQQGSARALEDLFARYAPRVRGLVAVRLGRRIRDLMDVEDVAQKALLEAFRRLDRFQVSSEGRFICWLSRFVEHEVSDAHRHARAQKRDRRRVVRLDATDVRGDVLPARGATPSQEAAAHELEERLEEALLSLAERYRQAAYFRAVLHMDYDEIAEEMQLKNRETARALCHKAFEVLERRLGRGPAR